MANPKRVRPTLRLSPTAKSCVDSHTGIEYASPTLMRRDQRLRRTRMLKEFAQMVADQTLGQNPWERLPIEDEHQYRCFREYLTMTPQMGLIGRDGVTPTRVGGPTMLSRSVERLSAHLDLRLESLKRYRSKFHWVLRAELWDRELDRQADDAFKESKRLASRRQAQLGQRLQLAAERGLNVLMTGVVDMSPNDCVRLADVGVKIERLAHDKSTSNEDSRKEVRFIFEGDRPKWADHSENVIEATQIEAINEA